MAHIVGTAVVVPGRRFRQSTLKRKAAAWLLRTAPRTPQSKRLLRLLDTFDRGLVERRASAVPLDYVFSTRGFGESNDRYAVELARLGERACRAALRRARVGPEEIDVFVTASCTGYMIPSVDAVLAPRLGLRRDVRRLPILQHGCAGGAVALSQAALHLEARPKATVLVMAAELPSLTFQTNDVSPENIVSAGLFGDGAAAVVLRGPDAPAIGGRRTAAKSAPPRIVAATSRLYPDSTDAMGFRLTDTGLKIILTKRIPELIHEHAVPDLVEFLATRGLKVADVDHWLLHPGGRKIVESFESLLNLGRGGLTDTRATLRELGNLSSATVLAVLDRFLRRRGFRAEERAMLVAFGPGLGSEMLLIEA